MNPYRCGMCDGLLGRKSENPYSYTQAISMASYAKGFMRGAETRKEKNIKLTIEKESV